MGGLFHAAQPYCSELDITLLFPKHRFPLPLDGDTPEERMEDLICQAENIYEVITLSSASGITYRFARWFCKVFRTEIPAPQMLKILVRAVKREY